VEKHRRFIFLTVGVVVLVCIIILSLISSQPLDKESLKENISDLASYVNESNFIMQQYQAHKVPFIYTKVQLQFINKKVTSLFDETSATDIPKQYQ
jgi:hypothetical protein